MEFFLFFFGWVGIGCAVIEYELSYNFQKYNVMTPNRKTKLVILLSMNLFCTFLAGKYIPLSYITSLVITVFFRYKIILQWKIAKKMLSPLDTLITTKYYQSIMLEVFGLLIAPYPGLEYITFSESKISGQASGKFAATSTN